MICEEGVRSEQFWVNSFEINRSCFNFTLNDEFKNSVYSSYKWIFYYKSVCKLALSHEFSYRAAMQSR